MGVPHLGGDPNANLYYQLKRDVLDRVPEISRVEFLPDRAKAEQLRATFDPNRLDIETGPESPTLTITWYRQTPDDWFRVNYSDPNTGFHAGWHQDEDHPDLGPAHFQYTDEGETDYQLFSFEHETPSLRLWEIIDHLFSDVLPLLG
ncbi:hypothetical protein DP107_18575 [Haloglomus irregulare]|jgi:hypothetical protein|uniref:Uncharacterized protein n=1 Tax=Haloglomus irregulare TaxID=2234134 RepID=A0A554MUB3_9EURY|nr:hypothetical protein [Haloglomus irregulare]TSD08724.1 hypothetical protein DP107_18575 [Haloglomus irregulare]